MYTYKYTNIFFCIVFVGCIVPFALRAQDTDNDGLTDQWEAFFYTDMNNPDTDGDGYMDGVEIDNGFSPHLAKGQRIHNNDYDGDGVNDWVERWFMSDIGNSDSDGDGYDDLTEIMNGYSPIQAGPTVRFDREIVVNLTNQYLYYLVDGIHVYSFPVSTGNPGWETPTGEFKIQRKVDVKDYVGSDYFVPDVWWNMQFIPMYYIHSAYWHNDFGYRTHSHGCVNMTIEDAKFLYKYVDVGLPVTVTGTTPSKYVVGT